MKRCFYLKDELTMCAKFSARGFAVLALVLLPGLSPAQASPMYSIVQLNAAGTNGTAMAINNSGEVTYTQDGVAYLYNNGARSVISGYIPGESLYLNDSGRVSFSGPINNHGDVATSVFNAATDSYNVVINKADGSVVSIPGSAGLTPVAINNSDEVALSSHGGWGVLWDGSHLITLSTNAATSVSSFSASGMNALGQIVGQSVSANQALPSIYSNGASTTIVGSYGGSAYAINNYGVVVGSAALSSSSPDVHAFVTQNGQIVDLNSLIPQGSGIVLDIAYGINDAGQILAASGDDRYLLTPISVPEPTGLLIFSAGAIATGSARLLRSRRTGRT